MKKLFNLLFLLPLLVFGSCSDDKDLAEVDIEIQFSGVTLVDDALYTVEGETVSIDNIKTISLTDQNSLIQNEEYFLDGKRLPIPGNYFPVSFSTEGFKIGKHEIGITGVVLQVDKTLTDVAASIPLNIVSSEEDLPEGAPEIGTYIVTLNTH